MNLREYNIALSQQSFKTLEEALLVMMEDKRQNPHAIMMLYPADDDLCDEWDGNDGNVSNGINVSNVPYFCVAYDDFGSWDLLDNDPLAVVAKLANEEAYVAEVADKIRKEYNVDGNEGWCLTALSAYDNNNVSVCLFIAPESWDKVKGMVEAYNSQAKTNGYKPLTLNNKDMIVRGEFSPKPENGGFFEKRKVKKQNAEQRNIFIQLINSLFDHLRRV